MLTPFFPLPVTISFHSYAVVCFHTQNYSFLTLTQVDTLYVVICFECACLSPCDDIQSCNVDVLVFVERKLYRMTKLQ